MPYHPTCDNLVTKPELSLKALDDLGQAKATADPSQALANFKRLPQGSTSNSDNKIFLVMLINFTWKILLVYSRASLAIYLWNRSYIDSFRTFKICSW